MLWAHQKQLVEQLSALGLAKRHEARQVHDELKHWMNSCAGSLGTVALAFALGSWWAAGRLPAGSTSNGRGAAIGLMNAAWLALQLANRRVGWNQTEVQLPAKSTPLPSASA